MKRLSVCYACYMIYAIELILALDGKFRAMQLHLISITERSDEAEDHDENKNEQLHHFVDESYLIAKLG
jgi:hypothetical protein